MSALQILDCEIERADGERIRADVLVDSGRIARLSPAGQLGHDATGDTTLVADGAALLPSLHDHHFHLFALAAWRASIDCSPTRVGTSDQLAEALRNADPLQTEPLRAVGYHESIAGDLDRSRLDVLAAGRAVRIQHRTGALWVLNSSALEAAGLADEAPDEGWPEGAEVDANGRSNGRFFRLDDWLSERLARANAERPAPDLSEVSRELAASGVASLTDATPRNDLRTARTFSAAWSSGALLQRVRMMSAAPPTSALSELIENSTGRLTWGERKVVLDDRDLPSLDEVAEQIAEAHAQGRGVAIHCVTRSELVLAAGALEQAGVRTGDRIEHASIAAPDAVDWLAQLGVRVVTQPGFIADRGDDYLRDVEAKDRPWLYRCAGFDAAGVALGAGTDAPYGNADPWRAIRAAVDRKTPGGNALGPDEALSPERALGLFTTAADAPGEKPRRIAQGEIADLMLLDCNWATAREHLDQSHVRTTISEGRVIESRAI